ncbi:hypothetical protein APY03_5168 [Variovorax sp. WDL1]|nr:hypothetical protein APY03_5168 [Variovorax sp. WDL1]
MTQIKNGCSASMAADVQAPSQAENGVRRRAEGVSNEY